MQFSLFKRVRYYFYLIQTTIGFDCAIDFLQYLILHYKDFELFFHVFDNGIFKPIS